MDGNRGMITFNDSLPMYQTMFGTHCVSYSSITNKIFIAGYPVKKLGKNELSYFPTIQYGVSLITDPWPPRL